MKFEDLKFVRLDKPDLFNLIPRYLFEQIPNREWDVDKLYEWGKTFLGNPLNLFWVLANDENLIKGVLWGTIDPVLEMIAVNILSVDKEYQHPKGDAITKSIEHLKQYRIKLNKDEGIDLKEKMLWTTTRPRAFERLNIKRSDRVVMEVSLNGR